MASSPELFVVCKNCRSQVSPYITECPYCGQRLRKRAPKLDKGGAPKAAKRRERISPNQELIGLGASNIAAAIGGGVSANANLKRAFRERPVPNGAIAKALGPTSVVAWDLSSVTAPVRDRDLRRRSVDRAFA